MENKANTSASAVTSGKLLGKYPMDTTFDYIGEHFINDFPFPDDAFIKDYCDATDKKANRKIRERCPLYWVRKEYPSNSLVDLIMALVFYKAEPTSQVSRRNPAALTHQNKLMNHYAIQIFAKDPKSTDAVPFLSTWDANISRGYLKSFTPGTYENVTDFIQKFTANRPWTTLSDLFDQLVQEFTQYCSSDSKSRWLKALAEIFQLEPEIKVENYNEDPDSTDTEDILTTISSLITEGGVRQLVLTGAPGTGKTYMAKVIADTLSPDHIAKEDRYELVQFHPSYDYTDFVEGLRPVEVKTGEKSDVTFKKVDGIFKQFCRRVAEENLPLYREKKARGDAYQLELPPRFFIIDEINRADLSNVLGELMYCLEKDKRGAYDLDREGDFFMNTIKTQYANLPTYDIEKGCDLENDCFKDGFYIPENIVILGTMNDIDRSVESFDFALRRRFTWFEVNVSTQLLTSAFNSDSYAFHGNAKLRDELCRRIMDLNSVMVRDGAKFGLNKHYFISQGHFSNLPEDTDTCQSICEYVWAYKIKNIIEEYIRGEDPAEVAAFLRKCEVVFCAIPALISVPSDEDTAPDNADVPNPAEVPAASLS